MHEDSKIPSIVDRSHYDDIIELPDGEDIILEPTAAAILRELVLKVNTEKPWINTDELFSLLWPDEIRWHRASGLTSHLAICKKRLAGSGFKIEDSWTTSSGQRGQSRRIKQYRIVEIDPEEFDLQEYESMSFCDPGLMDDDEYSWLGKVLFSSDSESGKMQSGSGFEETIESNSSNFLSQPWMAERISKQSLNQQIALLERVLRNYQKVEKSLDINELVLEAIRQGNDRRTLLLILFEASVREVPAFDTLQKTIASLSRKRARQMAAANRKAVVGASSESADTGEANHDDEDTERIQLELENVTWNRGPYKVLFRKEINGKTCLIVDASPAPPFKNSGKQVDQLVIINSLRIMIQKIANNRFSEIHSFSNSFINTFYDRKGHNRIYVWMYSNISVGDQTVDFVLLHIGSIHKEHAGRDFEKKLRNLGM